VPNFKFQIKKIEKNLNLTIRKKPTTTANKQTEPIRTSEPDNQLGTLGLSHCVCSQ
jgi:hypothetical protein